MGGGRRCPVHGSGGASIRQEGSARVAATEAGAPAQFHAAVHADANPARDPVHASPLPNGRASKGHMEKVGGFGPEAIRRHPIRNVCAWMGRQSAQLPTDKVYGQRIGARPPERDWRLHEPQHEIALVLQLRLLPHERTLLAGCLRRRCHGQENR